MSKATYTNTLSPIAQTRVCSDRNIVLQDKIGYGESGIYFHFNEVIDNKFKLLILGSDEISNPYFGGFFMFSGLLPDQYPFYPPHILAKTQGEGTRFHPNYYVSGKCCLSILGTWSGPPWTSCQNIGSVSQALKSLFIENPITQEPGFEKCIDNRSYNYSKVVEYRTLKIAVLGMLDKPPNDFDVFIPVMEQIFLKLYPTYIEKLDNLMEYDNKVFTSPIYNHNNSMKQRYNIVELKELFEDKYSELSNKYNILLNVNEPTLSTNTQKCNKRKCPNEPSKNYEVGYQKLSENDNNMWIVKENKNNVKRWVKV